MIRHGLITLVALGSLLFSSVASVAAQDLENLRIRLDPFAEGLAQPVYVTHAGDGSGTLYVLEKEGRIRTVAEDGTVDEEPFLDISDRVVSAANEQGLVGLAFHPEFEENGRFFTMHTRTPDERSVLSEYRVVDGSVDVAGERILMEIPQLGVLHNGSSVVFDNDGYLLVGSGDGGNLGETSGLLDDQTLWGKLLRIDVDSGEPYAIPEDNAYLDDPSVLPEAHAIGLRHPYRFSVDPNGGHIYIGDVGHDDWEELNVIPDGIGGLDFGWDQLEGPTCAPRPRACDPGAGTPPAIAFNHFRSPAAAIIGGYAYDGTEQPLLDGVYVYGEWYTGDIWGVWRDDLVAGYPDPVVLATLPRPASLVSFGEDEQGELYAVSLRDGTVLKVRAVSVE